MAGELDDRWLRSEEAELKARDYTSGREESPDTGLRQQTKPSAFGSKVNPLVRFADPRVNGQRAW